MEFGEQRRVCVPSSYENVRKIARFCRDACDSLFNKDDIDIIELAIVEAANNTVEHAYSGKKGNPIELSITRLSDSLEIKIYDSGIPYAPSSFPYIEPDLKDDIINIPEGGRGLFIIKSIMDDISFSRESGLNVLILRKKVSFEADLELEAHPFIHEYMAESALSQKEMKTAVNMHNNIVPNAPPEIPGYLLYARSESALQIGGDYIAFHQIDDNSLWFMVCDAMGKGMSAAFFTLLAHMVFKSILHLRKDITPGKLLTITNKIMANDFDRFGMFITALTGKIDISSNRLYYASAGHCPPIIFSPGYGTEALDTQDFMMGVDSETEYKTYGIAFEKGMKLLAYTDGITDILDSSGEMIGVEPLFYACAMEFKNKNIIDASGKIFSDALIATGEHQQDDISIIGIEKL